ncbi:hypothetical protein TOPH_05255 [Tolypocladium ophioglossoides CBS 100239]|uniref:Uncharacterized protein n=1 Tax=Tolypocladium ophioglossoides (strain CBS 100239) TaxID=1163406 RepID=A0A0L0N7E6_TOLOC|nr:hypothetical protein TOPH_05255 [Tolypocladium ophioglossoides CBS 100239]
MTLTNCFSCSSNGVPSGTEFFYLTASWCHVLIEKPFCTDISSGKKFLENLDRTGVKSLPHMVTAKHIASSGSLEIIIAINDLWITYKPLD